MTIWTLLIIMQFKHFIADYPLQGKYMLGKFKDNGWVLPLSAHCGVHLVFTFLISFIYTKNLLLSVGLSILDFTIHFIMDRIKASTKLLGRYEALSKGEFKGILSARPMLVDGINKIPNLSSEFKIMLDEQDRRIKSNTYFWYSLGLDQMVHHLTDILIVFFIVGSL